MPASIIGDVHGQADDLGTLLNRMGHRPIDGAEEIDDARFVWASTHLPRHRS